MITITTVEDSSQDIRHYNSIGEVSDGYHTFNELYEHRIALFIALMKSHPKLSWWSRKHEDGSEWKGWIIAGMTLPSGDVTYHLNESYADKLAGITELAKGKKWDGHTPGDVVKRLLEFEV